MVRMMRSIALFLLCGILSCQACELLVKAREAAHPDPIKDRVGRMKIGMIADIREDGFRWGRREGLPRFVVIKLPGVDPAKAAKYLDPQLDKTDLDEEKNPKLYRPRVWKIDWSGLPAGARNKLSRDGKITIKASPGYSGSFDYTWIQFRAFIKNLRTNSAETQDL